MAADDRSSVIPPTIGARRSATVSARRGLGTRPAIWMSVGGVLALCGLLLVYTVDPSEAGFFPPCWLYQLTGWHCPGCGSTRALHALLHGDLPQALAFNPIFVFLMPAVGLGMLWRGVDKWRGRPARTRPLLPGSVILALAAALVMFGLLRNVPGWPFELLAPHQVAGRTSAP